MTPVGSVRSSRVSRSSPQTSSVKRGRETVFGSAETTSPPSPTKRSRVLPRKFVVVNGVKYYASRSPSPPLEPTARRPSPFPIRLDSSSPVPDLDSFNSPVTLPSTFPSATAVSVRAEPMIHTPSQRHITIPRSRSSSYEMPDITDIMQSCADSSKSSPSPKKRITFASPSALPPPPSAYPSPSGVSPKSNTVSRSSVSKSSTAGRALRDLQIREAMQSASGPAQSLDADNVRSALHQYVSLFFGLALHLMFFSSQHGLLVRDPSTVGALTDEGCLKRELIDERLNPFYSLVMNLPYVVMFNFLCIYFADFALVL